MFARPLSREGKLAALPYVMGAAVLIQAIDATVMATALPAIARSMRVDPVTATLVLTAYLVGMACTVPAGGWLADRFGGANVIKAVCVLVAICAGVSASARDFTTLIAARFAWGAVSSFLLPVGRLMVVRGAPRERMAAAVTTFATIGLIGPTLGPVASGALVELFGWRSVAWLFVPLSLIMIVAVSLVVDDDRMDRAARLDVRGLIASGGGLASLVVAMELFGMRASWAWIAGAAAMGLVLLGWLYIHSRSVAEPLIQFRLLERPVLRASVLSDVPIRMVIAASPMLVSLLMQIGLHQTALATGFVLLAPAIGNFLVKPAISVCGPRYGLPRTMAAGGLIGSIAFCTVALCGAMDWKTALLVVLGFHGLGRAVLLNGGTILNYAQVTPAEMGTVTGLSSLFQQAALVGGIGTATMLLRLFSDGPLQVGAIVQSILVMGLVGLLSLVPLKALVVLPKGSAALQPG